VLEREITEQQAAEDLARIQSMWEMAVALQVLKIIKLMRANGYYTTRCSKLVDNPFSMAALEDALVRSPGPGLLAEVHIVSAPAGPAPRRLQAASARVRCSQQGELPAPSGRRPAALEPSGTGAARPGPAGCARSSLTPAAPAAPRPAQDLLQGLTKSVVTETNWPALLAGRLVIGCTAPLHPKALLPFTPARGKEAAVYSSLPAEQRWGVAPVGWWRGPLQPGAAEGRQAAAAAAAA
jgi:hypothetical protein